MIKVRIGNSGLTEEFGPSKGRTDFQTAYVEDIIKDPNTDFLCINPMCDLPYSGPFALTFFTGDGKMHMHWVGQKRLLRVIS